MLSVNLEYLSQKTKCRILSVSRNQTFTADASWGSWELYVMVEVRLKKLYKICTDDYDNNEYLAVKYMRFFTNDIVCL